MRKCLLLVALLICAQWTELGAQALFEIPSDTVCVRQNIQITNHATNASTYYWGFCSGYLANPEVVTNLGTGFGLDQPSSIELMRDGDNYYAFAVTRGTGNLIRLSYGTSLSNTPTVTNLGNLEGNIPVTPNNLYLMKDGTNWFMWLTGGSGASSSLTRIDFRNSLANTPNSVSFGNLAGLLNEPSGVFVSGDAGNYYGYITNKGDNKLLRLSFGSNISFTPTVTDLGIFGGAFGGPSDMYGVLDNGFWYLFITNETASTLTRVDVGNTLANNPAIVQVSSVGGALINPSSITIIRDCDLTHAYITNRLSNELVKVEMPTLTGPYTATNLGGFTGAFNSPADISRVIREKDNLYSFVVNTGDNSITQIKFPQCANSNVQSSTSVLPPPFQYDLPGYYNIYLAINEGMPDAQVQCTQVRVLPIPPITLSKDTTICQGDTASLFIISPDALSYTWRPNYNITDTIGNHTQVYPEYTVPYFINIPYPDGCIVDTFITVNVHKNHADAGPDRTLADGSGVLIGGPLTTKGPQYTYTWFPNQYMENAYVPVTRVNPASDITYYLEVRDIYGCVDIDTMVVHVNCNDINLPNAFAPESHDGNTNTFGLLNRQIVQLNYFRIFDRWGKQVFSTTDATKRWDGMVNGEPAPLGVYVWEADGFCISQRRFTKSGNVTLIR